MSADPDGLIDTDDKLKLKFSEIGNFREIEENRSRDAKISDGDSARIYPYIVNMKSSKSVPRGVFLVWQIGHRGSASGAARVARV